MLKKSLIIFGFALMVQLVAGCVDCNCAPVRKIYFTKKGISLSNLDSALPDPKVSNASLISSANYGIQVRLLVDLLAIRKQHINWGLIQTAQACSCPEDKFLPKEDILSIEIFSNSDYDATHPKNTDLSTYFNVKHYPNNLSIADYIKLLKENQNNSPYAYYEGIFLQVAPKISKKHKFRIKITLSDNRILEAETTEIELN